MTEQEHIDKIDRKREAFFFLYKAADNALRHVTANLPPSITRRSAVPIEAEFAVQMWFMAEDARLEHVAAREAYIEWKRDN